MGYISVFQTLLHADPFWLGKIITGPQILVHVSILVQCPDDRYP